MSNLLWFVMLLLAVIPAMTCFVYYHRRLGTRRELLKQTLISLQLEEAYVCLRHGEIVQSERKAKFDQCFQNDFRAGLSLKDYLWPVSLATTFGLIGWFLTFSRAYPSFTGLFGAKTFLPDSFAYGFVGAFLASMLTVFDDFRTLNLDPNVYYSITYRMLFSSAAAYLAARMFADTFSSLAAFGIGLFPIEKTWKFVTDKTAQVVGIASNQGEPGAELANIQGLEDQRSRQRLLEVDIYTVQALATADPLWIFFQTTFPLRAIIDLMDKAILYLYIGETVKELRTHGINGAIELVALVPLADRKAAYGLMEGTSTANPFFAGCDPEKVIAKLGTVLKLEPDEFRAFIYNLYYDPVVRYLYDIWGKYLILDDMQPAPTLETHRLTPQAGGAAAGSGRVSTQMPVATMQSTTGRGAAIPVQAVAAVAGASQSTSGLFGPTFDSDVSVQTATDRTIEHDKPV